MGRHTENRKRWPGAADHASHEAAQLLPPLPEMLHVKAYRVTGQVVIEVTATTATQPPREEYVGRVFVPGALLDLRSYSQVLLAVSDELRALARHIQDLKR